MKKFEITFDENKNYEQYQAILKLTEYWDQPKEKPIMFIEYKGRRYNLESVTVAAVD